MCSITYLEYRVLALAISLSATPNRCHCGGGAATLSRLDLVGFDKNIETFLSCYFRIFEHGTMDLEHL